MRPERKAEFRMLGIGLDIIVMYVGGIERRKRNPSLLVMVRIASALSVPLTKLLSE